MKRKKFFMVFAIMVVIALTATTVFAASPYLIDSFSMPDPLDPSVSWWRDTTNQNAIAQHSEDEFTGTVYQPYISSKLRLLVYSSLNGTNSIALVGTSSWYLVGPGGGSDEAYAAKRAFQSFYPGFNTKTLKGIVLTGANPEESWGGNYWRMAFHTVPPASVYASAAFFDVQAERTLVDTEITAREDRIYGHINRRVDDGGDEVFDQMAWGSDGFLGAGSMRLYAPVLPSYTAPNNLISEDTTFNLDGAVPFQLLPASDGSSGLMVWLPDQKILVAGDGGRYLPDAGAIYQASVSIPEHVEELNQMIGLASVILAPVHGMYISGAENVVGALTAQRNALQSIYDQTLVRINAGDTIDEAAAAVALPADLAASPYNQELVSTVPGIVRNVYQEKMGWFSGNITDLTSTLTETAKAQALSAAFAYPSLVEAAKQAELSAQDLPSAEKALYLAFMAYKADPNDFTIKQIYAQTLRKNAFMQKSAQIRNYYLTEALSLGTEQMVSDITRTGDEGTVIAFSAAEFSGSFFGISGASLETVKIVTLPPAENGLLALAGASVTAGQEIPLAELDGLTFTPTDYWNGTTSFTWNGASGGTYAPNDATVTITLNPVNESPTISATPLADVTLDEDAANGTIDLSTGFSDVDIATDGDVLTYTVTNSSTDLVSTAVDGSSLTLTYQLNKNGQATITVTATDLAGTSVSDDFAVTVNPINDAPTAADASITVVAGKSQTITLVYSDLETAQANLQVTFGSLQGTLDTSALPNLTYTAPATAGDDSFTYTVTDLGDPDGCSTALCAAPLSITATIHVTVLAAPSASIAGTIFNDANANGILDAGEGGLAGVVVQLQDVNGNQMETFTTGADGAYTFTGLEAGSYQVYAPKDNNRVQTTQNPIAVTLVEAQAATGANIGSVISADLKVSMTASVNNKTIIYAITVTNDGPAAAVDASLTDILPDSIAYVSVISTQGTCSGGKTVTCSFGTIASGGSVTVTLKVNRVSKLAIVNTATVTSSTFDIDSADNIVTKTVQ